MASTTLKSGNLQITSGTIITSKRGHSAKKTRDKALSAAKEQQLQQTPVKDCETSSPQNAGGETQTKNLLQKRPKKPAYMQSLNEQEKAENFKIIDNMNKKISYKKNPRFTVNKAPILFTQAAGQSGSVTDPKNPFRVEPQIVQFVDYQVNGIYEIPLKITNGTGVCKRIKLVPPTTENFSIRSIKYPNKETGDVAPGMSVNLSIAFSAPSFGDFDDYLTVVTEENSFKVPLRARRDPPVISLVNPLDCLHSWIGDRVDMAFRCVNTGGDGGFKFFCERDEDDFKQTDNETIRLGPFTLTPSEFYLYSGNAIDIYVSFAPDQEGQVEQNLILACDNQTSEFYKLTGYGAKLDLDIVEVDGRPIDFKKNPFETLFFENTNPTSTTRRKIKIKNSSPILVPFHWSVYKSKTTNMISLTDDEQSHYRVEPVQGKIQAGQTQEFTIFFSPEHAEPYFEFVDLIVEDIPIQSVRNPPEGLKAFALQAPQPKSRIPMPTYVGSNTQFMSIPLLSMNLKGQGNSCEVFLQPEILFFEGDLFINHPYTKCLKLRKDYDGIVHYKLRMEGKSSEGLSVNLKAQNKTIQSQGLNLGEVIDSKMTNEKEVEIEVTIQSANCGDQEAFFYCEVEDGAPLSFSLRASFKGPTLKLIEPVIDFGLQKINTSNKFRINIENTSPIPGEILIKPFKHALINFANFGKSTDLLRNILTTEGNSLKLDKPTAIIPANSRVDFVLTLDSIRQETLEEYFEILIKDSDTSLFFQVIGDIQKPRVCLNRNVIKLGTIYAGVQERVDVDHKQAIVLKNYGNIPAQFQWEEKYDNERIVARFEPKRGVIPPKSEVRIQFITTLFYGGAVDELFICQIEDLEIPLGFELSADAFGLNVSHEIAQDLKATKHDLMSKNSMNNTATSMKTVVTSFSDIASKTGVNSNLMGLFGVNLMSKLQKEIEGKQLKTLEFPNCKINKPTSQKFILKNLSGIKTSFNFSSVTFEPVNHVAPSEKSEIQKAMEAQEAARQRALNEPPPLEKSPTKGGKQIRFADTTKASNMSSAMKSTLNLEAQKRTKAILSDEHEHTQKFSSVSGNTFTQTKKIEKEQSFYLQNNKGLAIVFNPHMGDLPAHSEIPITVTIYNNVCGKFDDKILSNVKGLPEFEFPISIGISGSPIVIPVNQVGLNYKTTPPTLPMPCLVTNSQSIQKTFKLRNTGIRAIQVDWKIFDKKDLENEDQDVFQMSVLKNQGFDSYENPYKFNFVLNEPEESVNSAFEVVPKSSVMGPREIQTFTVTFFSNKGVGEFHSIMMATPELSKDELELAEDGDEFLKKGALGIISLNLSGETIDPILTIDKKSRSDGENHLNFKYWSIPNDAEAPSAIQKIIYTNNTSADLTFNMNIAGPFEIAKTKSNTGAVHPLSTPSKIGKKVETMFCLQPLKIIEIDIKFKAPHPTNNEEWPMIVKNERHGELVAQFSNGQQQKLLLDAMLLRPMLSLLTEKPSKNTKAMDELDLGTVHIEKFRTVKVFLSNITEVTAKWRLNYVSFPKKQTVGYSTMTPWESENLQKCDDPDVFEFSVTDGSLKGRSIPLRKLPEGLNAVPIPKDDEEKKYLPQTILINFRPKKNVLYKSKFRFTVENGISCDVILKGNGSYEENHD